jgi:citrate synthase
MPEQKATLRFDEKNIELPIYEATLGQSVIDVGAVKSVGAYTFDPGFLSTASCESKITFISGSKGQLLYRGYPIEQLAEKSTFMEVSYLLLHGELPTKIELDAFITRVKDKTELDPIIPNVFSGFKKNAHPMAMLIAAGGALAGLYDVDITDPKQRIDTAINLIAKMPILVALCKRHSTGDAMIKPRKDLDYAENFLHMLNAKTDDEQPNKLIANALDRIFILHADHEQNASTTSVRLTGSTDTNPYAAFTAGFAALWGRAHGGANEAALKMLKTIEDETQINKFVARAKDKNDPFRLMGFGHRVYKNFDPRAKIMQKTCADVLKEAGVFDAPLFKVAMQLQNIALEDDYFISRKLYPNVDYYSGVTQSAIGIPAHLFTGVFALGRTPGWMSHWHEMLSAPYKIGRPRQLYTGYTARDYADINQR